MTNTPLLGRADLHIHTTASDGAAGVQELLKFVAMERTDLNVIAITDHDTLDASLWAMEQAHRYPFDIVPGVEVSSRDGHVLALWVTTPIPTMMSLKDTVTAIHEADGLAILAHPFHLFLKCHLSAALRHWRQPAVLQDSEIDGIEIHNAAVFGLGCNQLARHFARKTGLRVTGGSDAHTLGAIASGVTRFPGQRATDLRKALQEGTTIAEGNPWPMRDYIAYFKQELRLPGMTSSAKPNSSPIINR